MRLQVTDAPWNLISTKKVVIATRNPGLQEGDIVELVKEDRMAVATIHKMEDSDADSIAMDKFLRDNLGVKIGEEAEIQIRKIQIAPDAQSVETKFPRQIKVKADDVRNLLIGSYVREGEKLYLSSNGVEFQIGRTIPKGVVKVVEQTLVEARSGLPKPQDQWRPSYRWLAERPDERFDGIAGLDEAKRNLKENIVYAIDKEKGKIIEDQGVEVKKGLLLYGPPGTGKTLLARATAGESDASFIYVPSSELKGSYYGETEKNMREVFAEAEANAPCVIFFDEIDAVGYSRSEDHNVNVLQQLLTLMDKVRKKEIYVIAATNRVDMIDKALLRPLRFNEIKIGLPNKAEREEIFRIHLQRAPTESINLSECAAATEGFSGADIFGICNDAKMSALRENDYSSKTKVTQKHVMAEIGKVRLVRSQERPDIYK